jgi:hypothetical protein
MRERTIISIPGPNCVGADFEEAASAIPGVVGPVGPARENENRFEVDSELFGAASERRLRELIGRHDASVVSSST